MKLRLVAVIALVGLAGCVTLTPAQQLAGVYVAKETGDIYTFSPNGSFTYTIGGPEMGASPGWYGYRANGELELGQYTSGGAGLWSSAKVNGDRSQLTVKLGWCIGGPVEKQNASPYWVGRELHLLRQGAARRR